LELLLLSTVDETAVEIIVLVLNVEVNVDGTVGVELVDSDDEEDNAPFVVELLGMAVTTVDGFGGDEDAVVIAPGDESELLLVVTYSKVLLAVIGEKVELMGILAVLVIVDETELAEPDEAVVLDGDADEIVLGREEEDPNVLDVTGLVVDGESELGVDWIVLVKDEEEDPIVIDDDGEAVDENVVGREEADPDVLDVTGLVDDEAVLGVDRIIVFVVGREDEDIVALELVTGTAVVMVVAEQFLMGCCPLETIHIIQSKYERVLVNTFGFPDSQP